MWTTPGSPTLLLFVLLYHEFPSGLFTIAVCVMSNFSKSRVLALQILTAMCGLGGGHSQVSDAVSMLRLRFGEPVRFKFLIGEPPRVGRGRMSSEQTAS